MKALQDQRKLIKACFGHAWAFLMVEIQKRYVQKLLSTILLHLGPAGFLFNYARDRNPIFRDVGIFGRVNAKQLLFICRDTWIFQINQEK